MTPRCCCPPNLRDWVPTDHIVHFVMDAVRLLEDQIAELLAKAEDADSKPLPSSKPAPPHDAARYHEIILQNHVSYIIPDSSVFVSEIHYKCSPDS